MLYLRASLLAQTIKNPPAVQETWVQSLGWEDLLRRAWQPTPLVLPKSAWTEGPGCSPWGRKESDMTERLSTAQHNLFEAFNLSYCSIFSYFFISLVNFIVDYKLASINSISLVSLSYRSWASLVAQQVKNPPAMWETWVGKIPWGREKLPTPVFEPGKFHGLCSPWDCKESDEEAPRLQRPRRSLTVRSYPLLKVKGSDRERQTATAQEWRPRGASPPPRTWAAAEKSYHTPEVRDSGQEEQPHLQGAAAARAQEGLEELPHV